MPEPNQPSPSSAEFRLDVDLANQAVAKLEEVRSQLARIKQDAEELSRQAESDQTAHDLISVEAAQILARKAAGPPGSLGVALDDGITYVQQMIDQMRSDIAQQEGDDESAARDLTAS